MFLKNRFTFQVTLAICSLFWVANSIYGHEVLSKKSIEHFIPLPMTRQATDYTCGAAAVQSVLAYYGDTMLESDLGQILRTNPLYGTDHRPMINLLESKNIAIKAYEGMTIEQLQKSLDEGYPVICLIQAWENEVPADYTHFWGAGHYVVAMGYDSERVYFMDPWTLGNYTYLPTIEFVKRWHHKAFDGLKLFQWGLVVQGEKRSFNPDDVLYIP